MRYGEAISAYAKENFRTCFREPCGLLKHRFVVPGSCYANELWDWDSWLADLALHHIAGNESIADYEKGCILNFLDYLDEEGKMPVFIQPEATAFDVFGANINGHKPCLAQHALFVAEENREIEWLRESYPQMDRYLNWYEKYCHHESGLYVWLDDFAIGVDNDPCTFYRPHGSSAGIYLNCMMYRELLAMARLGEMLGESDLQKTYEARAKALYDAVQEHCWDDRDGFFYNVDVNLLPVDLSQRLHRGCPRHWTTLIQRIEVWSGFMAMWAGIATEEQARRMVEEHYRNEKTFHAPYGVRTLSKMEKMYAIIKSGNPSCWLGPIWGISNYMVFDGLCRYGYVEEAKELAEKTLTLFGRDIEACGQMHEYYHPETGEGVNNPGFQNWNLLSLNMYQWLKTL
ncbi:MAG: glycoside hydrolase family 37 [Clostridia bacterium]|nr:glycoside hydrolase family 37 [Clostridia bacterium]